jgi:prefoldin alpha subunit
MAAMEQRINEMVQQSRVLEAYMNDVMTRQVTVTRLMEEARLASTTIQNITSESEVESLMPMGIGVYVKTMVPPIKKLLVNLGAGVAVEKSREDALNYVESRIKEYEVAARQLEAQRQELAMRMDQLQSQINQMIRAAQQPG